MKWTFILVAALLLRFGPAALGADPVAGPPADALKNTTILIIRHAEKPDDGDGLTPAGEGRARAYVGFFHDFRLDGVPLQLDHLFCTADSKGSRRPRLTLTPLSQALHLPLDNRFSSKEAAQLAAEIRTQSHGRELLVCWHHGQIPQLLAGLGADPGHLLPNGKWPDDVFGWLIELRYDAQGRLSEARLINESLLPDDRAVPATHV